MIGWTLDPTPGRKDYVDLCCSIKSFPCLLNAPCQCLTEFAISLVSGCPAGRLLQVYRETVEVSGLYPKMCLISFACKKKLSPWCSEIAMVGFASIIAPYWFRMGKRLSLGASAACPNSALSVPHDSHPPLVLFSSSSSHRNLQCYQSL
jgi:hypothetical protein